MCIVGSLKWLFTYYELQMERITQSESTIDIVQVSIERAEKEVNNPM